MNTPEFKIPENYFENLKKSVFQAVEKQDILLPISKKRTLYHKLYSKWSIAASILILIGGISSWQYYQKLAQESEQQATEVLYDTYLEESNMDYYTEDVY